jgi:ketosteroid isomerase-like protein
MRAGLGHAHGPGAGCAHDVGAPRRVLPNYRCANRNVIIAALAALSLSAATPAGAAPLTQHDARALLENALAALFDPKQDAASLSRFFAPDYVQDVDGKRLDYAGFIQHAETLKQVLRSGRATIEQIIVQGSTFADIHVVEAEKMNGDRIKVKVIGFFEVRDGKIVRVDELTHLIRGSAEDSDLGSRTSH